jgi:hypothetical protein
MEDSERSRTACVSFLRHRLIYFYPDHPELLERIYKLANELGGSLSTPPLRWHYNLIRSCFGWRVARAANVSIPWCKTMLFRNWDRLIYKYYAASGKQGTPR